MLVELGLLDRDQETRQWRVRGGRGAAPIGVVARVRIDGLGLAFVTLSFEVLKEGNDQSALETMAGTVDGALEIVLSQLDERFWLREGQVRQVLPLKAYRRIGGVLLERLRQSAAQVIQVGRLAGAHQLFELALRFLPQSFEFCVNCHSASNHQVEQLRDRRGSPFLGLFRGLANRGNQHETDMTPERTLAHTRVTEKLA